MYPKLRLRHCARGKIGLASPSSGAVAYLFNNSTGRDLLAVWHVSALIELVPYATLVGAIQGHNGNAGGATGTLVTGETAMPGALYVDDTATPPASDFYVPQNYSGADSWPHDYPLAILQPGWSLFLAIPGATGAQFNASFLWQRCGAEDIDGSLEDFALKLAGA